MRSVIQYCADVVDSNHIERINHDHFQIILWDYSSLMRLCAATLDWLVNGFVLRMVRTVA